MHEHLWAGSIEAYDKWKASLATLEQATRTLADINTHSEYRESLVSVHGDVAVINITGSLVNGSTGYVGQMMGVTGYDDIKAALGWSLQQPNVKGILYNVSSGGGEVAGVDALSQTIAKVSKLKPSATFTDGGMNSAAAWLGAASGYVVSSPTAVVGSIGILSVHMEHSKALEYSGRKVTLFRAGTHKALANPYEPLSDSAKQALQEQADTLYAVFLGRMADNRGLSKDVADAKFGQGRVFVGQQAVAAGLVDEVGSLETAMAKVKQLADKVSKVRPRSAPATNTVGHNLAHSEILPMPTVLTDEQILTLASSASVEVVADVKPPEPTPAPSVSPAATEPSVLDKLLVATAELTSIKAECATLQSNLAQAKLEAESLQSLARQQVKTLGIHFGVQASAVDSLSTPALLAEYERLSALFVAKFPGGRVAAPKEDSKPRVVATLDPLLAARLNAAKSR
jgi:signal peptide peptidase SppA